MFFKGEIASLPEPALSTAKGSLIGWYRDAASEPPSWNLKPVLFNQTVTITVPGTAAGWKIDFYDTKTGTKIVNSASLAQKGDKVMVTLPVFSDDIAFKMNVQ